MRVTCETLGTGEEPDAIVVRNGDGATIGAYCIVDDAEKERQNFEKMLLEITAENRRELISSISQHKRRAEIWERAIREAASNAAKALREFGLNRNQCESFEFAMTLESIVHAQITKAEYEIKHGIDPDGDEK